MLRTIQSCRKLRTQKLGEKECQNLMSPQLKQPRKFEGIGLQALLDSCAYPVSKTIKLEVDSVAAWQRGNILLSFW